MFHECTHMLASGRKCKAPAANGGSLCRHHGPRKHLVETAPFVLPEIKDQRSLLDAVIAVLEAASRRRIKRSEAGTFLFGLHLAARLMDRQHAPDVAHFHQNYCCEAESCIPLPGPLLCDPHYEPTLEEAEQFLATMQSTSVEHALNEWVANRSAQSLRSKPQNQPR